MIDLKILESGHAEIKASGNTAEIIHDVMLSFNALTTAAMKVTGFKNHKTAFAALSELYVESGFSESENYDSTLIDLAEIKKYRKDK